MSGRAVIVLAGNGSGCGKTVLAERWLALHPGWAAMKVRPHGSEPRVSREMGEEGTAGTDTARFKAAGADPVLLVEAPPNMLQAACRAALDSIPPGSPLLIEGRGALEAIRPSAAVLVFRPALAAGKGSIAELARGFDVIFVNEERGAAVNPEALADLSMPMVRGSLADGSGVERLFAILGELIAP